MLDLEHAKTTFVRLQKYVKWMEALQNVSTTIVKVIATTFFQQKYIIFIPVGRVGYDTSELKNSANQPSGGSIYPTLPRGETTERPNIGYQGPIGPGYQGGQIGSGYPGQARPNYPQQPYPQQGYSGYNGYNPQSGYQGYPQQGGYPNYNYNQRYPNNYPGGYSRYPPQNSGSGSFVDSLTGALKKYGTNLLKNAIANQLAGNNNRN